MHWIRQTQQLSTPSLVLQTHTATILDETRSVPVGQAGLQI